MWDSSHTPHNQSNWGIIKNVQFFALLDLNLPPMKFSCLKKSKGVDGFCRVTRLVFPRLSMSGYIYIYIKDKNTLSFFSSDPGQTQWLTLQISQIAHPQS